MGNVFLFKECIKKSRERENNDHHKIDIINNNNIKKEEKNNGNKEENDSDYDYEPTVERFDHFVDTISLAKSEKCINGNYETSLPLLCNNNEEEILSNENMITDEKNSLNHEQNIEKEDDKKDIHTDIDIKEINQFEQKNDDIAIIEKRIQKLSKLN